MKKNLSQPSCPCQTRFVLLVEAVSFAQGTQHPIARNWCDHNDGKVAASFERRTDVGLTYPFSELSQRAEGCRIFHVLPPVP